MPISTFGVRLLRGDSAEALKPLCRIKSFPDLIGDPNLIDVTDLEDSQQTNIFGVDTVDILQFIANYEKEVYDAVAETANTDGYYALMLSDKSGWSWQGQHRMGVPGKGVDEAIEFSVNIINTSPLKREDNITVSEGP